MLKLKFNLQLFTDPVPDDRGYYADTPVSQQTTQNIASPYAGVSSGTALYGLTPEIKEFYSNYLIKNVGPNLVYAQFGEKEKLPASHGMTIEWRKWEDFKKATTPLTEGVTPVPHKLSVNPIRKTLNQYGDWTPITDRIQMTAIDKVVVEITEKHAENAKLTLDTLTREDLITGCTNAVYAGGTTVKEIDGTLTPALVAKMATYLKNNNAPKYDGSYVAIIHPSVAHDLMTSDKWIDVVKYSDATRIFNGEIGKIYGVRFVESTESKLVKGTVIGTGDAAAASVPIASVDFASTAKDITLPDDTLSTADATTYASAKFWIESQQESTKGQIVEVTASSISGQTITLSAKPTTPFTPAAGDILYSKDSAKGGKDYFVCLFLGKGAYRTVDINGDNARIIVKPNGYGDDPLDQRASVGWKVDAYAAAVTNPAYIFKLYVVSSIEGVAAND